MPFRKEKPRRNNRRNDIPMELECYFCKLKENPNYKEVLKLRRFITDRGKIIPKSKSGTCSKHQRVLNKELKIARFLSLLPYTERHAL